MSDTQYNLYFSHVRSLQYITAQGKAIVFVSGRYATKDPEEIAELDYLVSKGSKSIFKDASKLTATEADLDPERALRAKFFAEFLAEQQAQLNPENDRGTSTQGSLNAASTTSIAAVAAGGDASSLHSQVAKLIPGPKSK